MLPEVDWPSLLMVLVFLANLGVCFFYPTEIPVVRDAGLAFLIGGSLFFVYVLFFLRQGFLGETEPKLDHLVMDGPYRFCRHPQYLSFIIMILGLGLMFRSIVGVVFTFTLSIPSVVYRARIEEKILKEKFGKEWEKYAEKVGFLLPKPKTYDQDREKIVPNSNTLKSSGTESQSR